MTTTINPPASKPESEPIPEEVGSELPLGLVNQIAGLAAETYFKHSPEYHREAFHKSMESVLTEASVVVDKPKAVVAGLWQHGLRLRETAEDEFELALPSPRSTMGEDPIHSNKGANAALFTLIGQGIQALETEAKGEHKDPRGSFDNFYREMINQHLRSLQISTDSGSTAQVRVEAA